MHPNGHARRIRTEEGQAPGCQLGVGKGRLVIPKHGDVVLLGGAEGLVVGGTGKYATAGGPYSTRLKLETIGGLFAYYDELFFRFREVDVQ